MPTPAAREGMMACFDYDKYRVESYAHGWQVAERSETSKGEPDLKNHRYYPSLQAALTNMLELHLRGSDADSLAAISDAIRAHRAALAERFTIKIDTGGL
jgi:hypothetical protein